MCGKPLLTLEVRHDFLLKLIPLVNEFPLRIKLDDLSTSARLCQRSRELNSS